MTCWTLRIGIFLIASGLTLASPVADILPLRFWSGIGAPDISGSASSSQSAYVRVVPIKEDRSIEFVLIGAGLFLVATALFFRRKN